MKSLAILFFTTLVLIIQISNLSSSFMPSHRIRRPTPTTAAAAAAPEQALDAHATAFYIIYTENQHVNEDPEPYHIRILTSVLGSEESARDALLYSYKHAASGFSAKLTHDQVAQISAQPGVLQVVPCTTCQLHCAECRK